MNKAKPRVYVETSIVSYLTARPSRNLIIAANQQLTQEWWQERRTDFDLYVSQLALEEIRSGDPDAARERLRTIADLPRLILNEAAVDLAERFIQNEILPRKASMDALHIAVATTNGVDYLLTWNCRHLANAILRKQIERLCRVAGYEPPTICTPQELLENEG
ncbi:MAG: type II toxin-antitoxin system VapC family toxin [Anaerolineae bacterium]|nr:type II toxin-antitoxin system VapC family toxin [Anaerolineae bacterium]